MHVHRRRHTDADSHRPNPDTTSRMMQTAFVSHSNVVVHSTTLSEDLAVPLPMSYPALGLPLTDIPTMPSILAATLIPEPV